MNPNATDDAGRSPTYRMLLVDDEADIREVLEIALLDMGYDVTTAANGREALEAFTRAPCPIVLTDIKMPGMDGIQLLKKIKRISPETQIIMITGHGDMDLAIESFRHEAVEFITKPVDVNTLEAAVSRAVEKIEMHRGIRAYTENLEALLLKKTRQLEQVPSMDERRQAILDSMEHLPMIVFLIDADLTLQKCNALFRKTFGSSEGRHCFEVCREQQGPCRECPARKTFETGEAAQARIRYTGVKDQEMNCLVWSAPVPSPSLDGPPMAIVMATDMTNVVDLQDHLTSLGLMIGSVSHGIKGLLTGLDGGVYMLNSALKKADDDQAREGLETVQEITAKIKKMILDILFYAKDRGVEFTTVSAVSLGQDLIRTLRPRAEKLDVRLISNLPDTDITFQADGTALHSALINILDNALDACRADRSKKDHQVSLTIRKAADQVAFSVSDNGTGMDPHETDRIFDLFHSSKGKGGTGLGLYITRHIIDQHGGRISLQSQPGHGTTFTVFIPQSPQAPEPGS